MAYKHVRFAVDDCKDEDGAAPRKRPRRTLLPGPEDDEEELEGELTEGYRGLADVEDLLWDEETEKGPIKARDPKHAAASRDQRRKDILRMACGGEGSLQAEIAAAEAEYEALDNRRWRNSGVPLEPFSLKREREAGYFDEEGYFVAYKDDEPEDAWLASLPRGAEAEEGDGDNAEGAASTAGAAQEGVQVEERLDADVLRAYKESLVDLLQTGESVFGALRRLGGLQRGPRRQRPSDAGSGAAGLLSTAHEHALRMRTGRTVPPEHRAEFERLTEMSSALLAHGDYHVHSASREALQADLRAHASGIPSQAPAPPSPSRHPAAAASPPAAAASGTAAAPGRDAQGWRAFAARIEVPPPESHAAAAAEADNAEAAAGEASALRAAAAAEAEAPQRPADPEEDIFAGVGSDTAWQAPGKAEPQVTAAGGGSASDDQSEDGDDPMAALERAALAQGEAAPHPNGASSAGLGGSPVPRSPHEDSVMCTTKDMATMWAGSSAACLGPEQQERSISLSSASHEDTCMAFPEVAGSAGRDSLAEGRPLVEPPMEGFEYDSSSGFFYNSLLGAYFDPKRQLFGDSASGHWYSLCNGEYQLVQ